MGAKTRRLRTRIGRALIVALVMLVIVSALAAGGGYIFVQRTLPQVAGTLKVAGLEQPVSVTRDQWGVPHITGDSVHDVVFAQGYVTAQDRLFQMEFNRRVAQGRLSEMFGAGTDDSLIKDDELLRTLDLYRSARTELAHADPQTVAELQAYADGVNAFISTHRDSLPLEFTILGISPQPWQPVDSLAYGRVVALSLDNQWYVKYTRALLLSKLPAATVNQLFPAYPATNPTLMSATGGAAPLTGNSDSVSAAATAEQSPTATVTPQQRAAYARLSPEVLAAVAPLHQLLGNITDALGSNDWVVDGTKTTTGLPLLANDPHLGISMPSIWYEVALRGGGLDVIGFSFPGVPGVVIGHNEQIAWGVTNVGADDTDLYLEKLDPSAHPGEYEYDGQWLPLSSRKVTIKVRGGAPVSLTIQETRDGPILNNVVSDLKNYAPVSLKWTALQPNYTFAGFFQLDFATDWQQFLTAISHISISQNFVYADTSGNIGYRMSGLLPIRPAANDLVPVDGSTSANEWQGYVPQNKMPVLFNPPTHVIATANNQIVPEFSSLYVTSNWDYGYRARRIVDLLTAKQKLSIADYQQIQADTLNVPATQIVPALVSAGKASGGDAAQAAHILAGWNDQMTTGSAAAALFEVTSGTLLRDTLEPVLGKQLYQVYRSNFSASGLYALLDDLIATPGAPFFGIKSTDETNAGALRNQALSRALAGAMAQLRSTLGNDPATWTWGALHKADFEHPLASVPLLQPIFGVAPVATGGDTVTVSVGGDGRFSQDPPDYAQRTVSSMRQIIDLSNWDASLWVTTTGESGEPFSAHYSDLVALWANHRYQRMEYSAASEGQAAQEILTLTP